MTLGTMFWMGARRVLPAVAAVLMAIAMTGCYWGSMSSDVNWPVPEKPKPKTDDQRLSDLDSDVATTENALARNRAGLERDRQKCKDLQNKPRPQWTDQERKDNDDYAASQMLVIGDEQRLKTQTKERDDLRNKVSADRARTQREMVARPVMQPLTVRPQTVEPCR
jgi:hypothetical protein